MKKLKNNWLQLLFLFLFISIGIVEPHAQSYPLEDIAKAFQYGNFKKCYKLAEKENKKNPEATLPYVYMAISLYEGQNDKTLLKIHPNPIASCTDLLKKGKPFVTEEDKIPSTFIIALKGIQKEIIRPIKTQLKTGNFQEATKRLNEFTVIFDNSNFLYFNYSTPSFINYCSDLLTGSSDDTKESLIRFSLATSDTAIDNLLLGKDNNISRRELQNIQDELYELITSCNDMNRIDLAYPIADFLVDTFDNRSEKYRNFHLWHLFTLSIFEESTFFELAVNKNLKEQLNVLTDSAYQFEAWNTPVSHLANTGKNASYLTQREKNILYIINLCRMNPKLFESTFLVKYLEENPDEKGSYASSLKKTLKKMDPLPPFLPDSLIFLASQLHAEDYGKKGKEGHGGLYGNPEGRMKHFGAIGEVTAENCDYGMELATEIVLHLLVDNGVSGVGHRKNLLAPDLNRIGISVQPHAQYDVNCVMDFMD